MTVTARAESPGRARFAPAAETAHRAAEGPKQASQDAARARPVLKWLGGKAKLAPAILDRVPETYGRYFEPFAGGAALFFALQPERAVIADSNADLMAMYRAVARAPEIVINLLENHRSKHSEAHYLAVRDAWNCGAAVLVEARAAALLYLNRACFNGLYRVNRLGEFNVGFGKAPAVKLYAKLYAENIRAASAVLARADLRTGDYRDAIADATAGDLVYYDPPYDGTFASYTPGKCTEVDQAEIAFTARTLAARGATVIVSNADTPRIRALYAGWTIDVVSRAGTVSCDPGKRGRVAELIITSPRRIP